MYDLIGDIHGHTGKLIELLEKLGYSTQHGVYNHPSRKALFIGDFIDRGPAIRETLLIVRSMVESGNAIALMGNHEYNALCFHYEEREGGHLRKHLIKNIIQHFETLRQFQNRQEEYENYIEWFKTLPLFFETNTFRAVHAYWDQENINYLRSVLRNDRINEKLLHQSVKSGTKIYRAIDESLKGKEIQLPSGLTFADKDGTVRTEIRVKWWEDPLNSTWRKISVIPSEKLPDEPFSLSKLDQYNYYSQTEKPVFFGHYWLRGKPKLFRENICCLDFSVARKGHLAAYRFNDEQKLLNKNFVFV
jgi:hypothetical protein